MADNTPKYAVIRLRKVKSEFNIRQASNHNMRLVDVPNADPEAGTAKLIAGKADALSRFNYLMSNYKIKRKSDSVLAINYVVSFSPEQKNNISLDKWAKDNIEFFENRHGRGSILQAVLHTDESTPHIHFLIIPIDKNGIDKRIKDPEKIASQPKYKLNCKKFTGTPAKLKALQSCYAKAMEHHGLERGIKNSKAKHKDIKEFYADINKNIDEVNNELSHIINNKPNIFKLNKFIDDVKRKIVELAHATKLISDKEQEISKRERRVAAINKKLNKIFDELGIKKVSELELAINNIIETNVSNRIAETVIEKNNLEHQLAAVSDLKKTIERLTYERGYYKKEMDLARSQLSNDLSPTR